MNNSPIFKTAVLEEKQTGFLQFLHNIGISDEHINYVPRGNYQIYFINLINFPEVRKKLVEHQTDFL